MFIPVTSGFGIEGPGTTRGDPRALAEIEQRLRHALSAEPDVRWAYLFGSAARGEAFRDVDVAVMLTRTARGAVALGRVAASVERVASPFRVDVIDLPAAAPALAGRIVREGRVLVDTDRESRRAWEIEANGRALDIEPWLAEFERLRNEALRKRAADG
jgi:predicted nucleotidyltransferase